MIRVVLSGLVAALALTAPAAAGPITKQNGSTPVIAAFTSICAVPGFAGYGLCGGDATRFTEVGGRLNAVQPKPGVYNLEFRFTQLTPGVAYRLWSTTTAFVWTEVGTMVADETGAVQYKLQTTSPGGLGFDLNTLSGDITIVTSWWSGQTLFVKEDGSLASAV